MRPTCLPALQGVDWAGGPGLECHCTVRFKLSNFEHIRGGPCIVRSNASWVTVMDKMTDRHDFVAGGNKYEEISKLKFLTAKNG